MFVLCKNWGEYEWKWRKYEYDKNKIFEVEGRRGIGGKWEGKGEIKVGLGMFGEKREV